MTLKTIPQTPSASAPFTQGSLGKCEPRQMPKALINKGFLRFSTTLKRCEYVIGAEQKARTTYDNILKLVDDPDVCDVIRFLRQREIVHFQRFGEAMGMIRDKLNEKNFYAFNPAYPLRK